MNSILSKLTARKKLLLIFGIAFVTRVVLFLAICPWQETVQEERIIFKDAVHYHDLAINLLEHQTFSDSTQVPYLPNWERVPVYPSFLASVYSIFGYYPFIAIFLQVIIGSITCVLAYKIGIHLFDEKTSFMS